MYKAFFLIQTFIFVLISNALATGSLTIRSEIRGVWVEIDQKIRPTWQATAFDGRYFTISIDLTPGEHKIRLLNEDRTKATPLFSIQILEGVNLPFFVKEQDFSVEINSNWYKKRPVILLVIFSILMSILILVLFLLIRKRKSTIIGDYKIERIYGEGAIAIIYKAYNLKEKRECALKVLKDQFIDDKVVREKFLLEGKILQKFNDQNDPERRIIRCFRIGNIGPRIMLELEALENGEFLKDYLKRRGTLQEKEALLITKEIALALVIIHKENIIHRDLDPSNIFIYKKIIKTKIIDFGVAKIPDYITPTQETFGKFHFMPPEQWLKKSLTPKLDIYSLGVILYLMLNGRLPFQEIVNINDLSKAIIEGKYKPIAENISNSTKNLLEEMLAVNPKDRPNAQELVVKIEKIIQNL